MNSYRACLLSITIFLFKLPALLGQNMVSNGGHEIYTPGTSPNDPCFRELTSVGAMIPPNMPENPPGIASACATPDHLCINARSGQAHGGFFQYAGTKFENPMYQLCADLEVGEAYEVTVWLALREGSGRYCEQIGFWFDEWGFHSQDLQIQITPDFRTQAGLWFDSFVYQPVSFSYKADRISNALIIGNFIDKEFPMGAECLKLPNAQGDEAYYLIDDIAVRPIPSISAPSTACIGDTVTIHLTNRPMCASPPDADWKITMSGQTNNYTGESATIVTNGDVQIVVVIASDTLRHSIKTNPVPAAWMAMDTLKVCNGEPMVLDPTLDGLLMVVSWSNGALTSQLTVTTPGTYTATLEHEKCRFEKPFLVLPGGPEEIIMPNVFTPNGDNVNDVFKVPVSREVTAFTMKVYSRWGREVYNSQNISNGWDGKFKGNDMPADVYAYLLRWTEDRCGEIFQGEQRGEVTLIR